MLRRARLSGTIVKAQTAARAREAAPKNERISIRPFLLWHFSPGDKIKYCPAQFLAVCWIVHVEFKVHHPSRHGRPI